MQRLILAMLAAASATAASAQPSPPAGPASPPAATASPTSPAAPGTDAPSTMAGMRYGGSGHHGMGYGASIRLRGPGGAEVTVRCAAGESTRACADVVSQLMERAMAARPERRRDDDDLRGERYRDRDRY